MTNRDTHRRHEGAMEVMHKRITDIFLILLPLLEGIRVVDEVGAHPLQQDVHLFQHLGHTLVYRVGPGLSPFELLSGHAAPRVISLQRRSDWREVGTAAAVTENVSIMKQCNKNHSRCSEREAPVPVHRSCHRLKKGFTSNNYC